MILGETEAGERETSATALLAACQVLSPSIIAPSEAVGPCLPPLSSWESRLAAGDGSLLTAGAAGEQRGGSAVISCYLP